MECWSIGVLNAPANASIHHFTTPPLHHSIFSLFPFPFVRPLC